MEQTLHREPHIQGGFHLPVGFRNHVRHWNRLARKLSFPTQKNMIAERYVLLEISVPVLFVLQRTGLGTTLKEPDLRPRVGPSYNLPTLPFLLV